LFVEGILSQQDLESYHKLGTFLLGHPVKNKDKGIEFSTGSLGLGLSLSSGLAYLYRRQNISRKVFCLVGDGELDEGSNWEALKFAQHHELSNLICLIDNNGFQQTGSKSEISNFKFAPSFFDKLGWEAAEVDGHSNLELFQSITNLINSKISKPKVIICNTIKGKGIKLMENNNDYHHKMITQSSYEEFLKII
jgi:transketolase